MRHLLRRVPYWFSGHLELASLLIERKAARDAYMSAKAAGQLARSASQGEAVALISGRALLALGAFDEARLEFTPLLSSPRYGAVAREELAACAIAQERFAEALQLLSELPTASRSEAVTSMLRYVKAKLSQSTAPR